MTNGQDFFDEPELGYKQIDPADLEYLVEEDFSRNPGSWLSDDEENMHESYVRVPLVQTGTEPCEMRLYLKQ